MPAASGKKSVLVTGCTPGGIGAAIAQEFHKQGLHVITTARRPEVLKEFVDAGMSAVALDVTSEESIAKCCDQVHELTGGKLDILVNNAGLTCTIPATDLDLADVRSVFETNVFGPMMMVKAFARQLIAARGLVVNIGSLSSVTPYTFGSAYCGTKAALAAYSRTLRSELYPFGVRVMVANVGTVRSNIAKLHRDLPDDSLYKPVEDVYRWRLTFSQSNQRCTAEELAAGLVAAALREPGWFSSGPPNWFWAGTNSSLVWFLSCIGEWAVDTGIYPFMRIYEMTRRLAPEAKKAV